MSWLRSRCASASRLAASARGFRQILQDDPDVVGAAKESAVDPPAHPRVNARPAPQQRRAEQRAQRGVRGVAHLDRQRQTRQRRREQQRQPEADETQQDQEAALHQHVARAAPQQDGDVEHALLENGVGERSRDQQQESIEDDIPAKPATGNRCSARRPLGSMKGQCRPRCPRRSRGSCGAIPVRRRRNSWRPVKPARARETRT